MSVTDDQVLATFLYANTTESLIPWDWLDKSRTPELLMDERERVEALLQAANGQGLTLREWNRLCGAPLTGVTIAGSDTLRIPLMDKARLSLRAALEAAVRTPESSIAEINQNAKAIAADRVISVPGFSDRGEPRDRIIAHSIGPALIYALRLLLDPGKPDPDKPFRRCLRQCAYADCGRFGLTVPPESRGQPPNFFCSDDHQERYRKKQNLERAAASRAEMSVEKYR